MFLIRSFIIVLFSLAASVFLPGCVAAYDAEAVASRRVSRQCDEQVAGEKSFLGFRRDTSPDQAKVRRITHFSDDSNLEPSAREQRIARAMARAESEIIEEGRHIMYRSDGSSTDPSRVDYVSMPGALTVNYQASERLNCVDGDAKALTLVVYHLSDRAALDQLSRHEDGMRFLLLGLRFDAAVKSVRKYHVQPGSSGELLFDRPQGGRYVAIVAGYNNLETDRALFVAEYGLGQYKHKERIIIGVNVTRHFFQPLPLRINMRLGSEEMSAKASGKMLGRLRDAQMLEADQVRYMSLSNL